MDEHQFHLETDQNRIVVSGPLRTGEMRRLFAALHTRVEQLGYKDIVLDFAKLTSTFAPPILSVASQCQNYLKHGIDTYLILPEDNRLKHLFLNANWAHLIDPRSQPQSTFRGHIQIPAQRFLSGSEQHTVVSQILKVILGSLKDFNRSHLSAIEWSINEITDNVLNHAESKIGGLVQVTSFSKNRKAVEFTVCDAGLGIPSTLRTGHPEIQSDLEALDCAIREGVTRGAWYGQGNGLYGSYRIAELTDGHFEIHSGFASLLYTPKTGFRVKKEQIPFNGTLVAVTIRYDHPLVLEQALKFRGRMHTPTDFVEVSFEEDEGGNVTFRIGDESDGFGSRSAGVAVRNKLVNLMKMVEGKIIVDFENVPLISSSYADEVFGKIFVTIGAIDFSTRFEFRNIDSMVKRLIDRSIAQRMQVS